MIVSHYSKKKIVSFRDIFQSNDEIISKQDKLNLFYQSEVNQNYLLCLAVGFVIGPRSLSRIQYILDWFLLMLKLKSHVSKNGGRSQGDVTGDNSQR